VTIRPIRPEDEPAHMVFFAKLTPEDIRLRFFGPMSMLEHRDMARFTQIDYDREMAFVATMRNTAGQEETLGVVRAVGDPDNHSAEFAVIIRSDQKGLGLGRLLMLQIISYCRARGTRILTGDILRENRRMRQLAQELGFVCRPIVEVDAVRVELDLTRPG
jgi:acetyltransferase